MLAREHALPWVHEQRFGYVGVYAFNDAHVRGLRINLYDVYFRTQLQRVQRAERDIESVTASVAITVDGCLRVMRPQTKSCLPIRI